MNNSIKRSGHAIVRSHNKFLLLRKNYGNPDNWHCPGGMKKSGENRLNAAIRETYEETGCKVAPLKQVYEDEYVKYFLCKKYGGHAHIKSHEIKEVKWFALDEVKALKESGRLKGCRVEWFELDNSNRINADKNNGYLCLGCSAPRKTEDKICPYCGRGFRK